MNNWSIGFNKIADQSLFDRIKNLSRELINHRNDKPSDAVGSYTRFWYMLDTIYELADSDTEGLYFGEDQQRLTHPEIRELANTILPKIQDEQMKSMKDWDYLIEKFEALAKLSD